jgi:biopolymer transport protein ExbD
VRSIPRVSRASPSVSTEAIPTEVRLAIDFDGRIFWNNSLVADEEQLMRYLRHAAGSAERPVVIVEPDARAPYERVAQVLAAAQRSGVERLSVVGTVD